MHLDIASLYRKHRRRAFSIAWTYLKDEEEALDAVQEAFIKAQRSGDRFDGRSSPQTWIYRIVINVCLDLRRRKSRRPELHVDDVDIVEPRPCSPDCPEKSVEDLERRAAIYEGLRRLSDNHRVVLVLREFSGLDYEQIAELANCPKGTVMSRLFHARRQLRDFVGRELDHPLLASVA
jgi:RNA polymerase sigma-70 factor, ECF subfamily